MTLTDYYPAIAGMILLGVLCWLLWVIERDDPLPAPDERAIVKERLWRVRSDAWDVSAGHTRYQEE